MTAVNHMGNEFVTWGCMWAVLLAVAVAAMLTTAWRDHARNLDRDIEDLNTSIDVDRQADAGRARYQDAVNQYHAAHHDDDPDTIEAWATRMRGPV